MSAGTVIEGLVLSIFTVTTLLSVLFPAKSNTVFAVDDTEAPSSLSV